MKKIIIPRDRIFIEDELKTIRRECSELHKDKPKEKQRYVRRR